MLRPRLRHPVSARTTVPAAAGLVVALAAAACSSGGGSTASSAAAESIAGQGARSAVGAPATPAQPGGPSTAQSGAQAGGATKGAPPLDPASVPGAGTLARRAQISLQVKNIGHAVASVRAETIAANGIVLDESVGSGDGPPLPVPEGMPSTPTTSSTASPSTYAEITVSVPSERLDQVVADLSGLGKLVRATSTSDDVGAQLVDTQSRLATLRTSVDRVRAFLAAAKDLGQIVTLESELTRRESDLESMEAQLAALKGSVARSPIDVSLTTLPVTTPRPNPQHASGFLAGLTAGWHAFTAALVAALTVVGAVLPFAVLALVLGLPVWWARRRRRLDATAPELAAPR